MSTNDTTAALTSHVFDERDGIAVAQICTFGIYLICGVLLLIRHGFGFFILLTFSLLRLVGASFQLATVSNPSRTNYTGALVCDAIGVAPLVVLNIVLLKRLNRFLPTAEQIGRKTFLLLTILSFVSLGLAVRGADDAASATTPGAPNTSLKIAIAMFCATYLISWLVFLHLARQQARLPSGEKRLLVCFFLCAPFIIVRLVYAVVGSFTGNAEFNIYSGNINLWLGMAVVPEIIAMAVVCGISLTLNKVEVYAKPEEEERQAQMAPRRRRIGRRF